MEQCLQPLLGVVVAELLKRGPPLLLGQSGVLETGSVHDQQGAQRVLTGLQSSKGTKGKPKSFRDTNFVYCILVVSTSNTI